MVRNRKIRSWPSKIGDRESQTPDSHAHPVDLLSFFLGLRPRSFCLVARVEEKATDMEREMLAQVINKGGRKKLDADSPRQ